MGATRKGKGAVGSFLGLTCEFASAGDAHSSVAYLCHIWHGCFQKFFHRQVFWLGLSHVLIFVAFVRVDGDYDVERLVLR